MDKLASVREFIAEASSPLCPHNRCAEECWQCASLAMAHHAANYRWRLLQARLAKKES